jgi:hypothetical protein
MGGPQDGQTVDLPAGTRDVIVEGPPKLPASGEGAGVQPRRLAVLYQSDCDGVMRHAGQLDLTAIAVAEGAQHVAQIVRNCVAGLKCITTGLESLAGWLDAVRRGETPSPAPPAK